MAAKKKNPGVRRAQKNARRATRKRTDYRPSGASRGRTLYDLAPPGSYYQEWDTPAGTDRQVMDKVAAAFGAESAEAATMRRLLEYRTIYGPRIPIEAAAHLDLILDDTDLVAQLHTSSGSATDDIRESMHSLHAMGTLLVADDGSLWMTIPPGTPHSAPDGGWSFIGKKSDAPVEPAPVS
ncbi:MULTISPECIES: hypothetical protein [unclassified Streptomyces]|uniref:hypothetical protein n=1 Tax=unclassified Streptomyces TaxID=2593676 RepID=UPI0004BD02BF|nr:MULTISPECIES: hypothetical protein [unclassified Streptomyces]